MNLIQDTMLHMFGSRSAPSSSFWRTSGTWWATNGQRDCYERLATIIERSCHRWSCQRSELQGQWQCDSAPPRSTETLEQPEQVSRTGKESGRVYESLLCKFAALTRITHRRMHHPMVQGWSTKAQVRKHSNYEYSHAKPNYPEESEAAVQWKGGATASVSHRASDKVRENQRGRERERERERERDVVVLDGVKTDLKDRGDSRGGETRE